MIAHRRYIGLFAAALAAMGTAAGESGTSESDTQRKINQLERQVATLRESYTLARSDADEARRQLREIRSRLEAMGGAALGEGEQKLIETASQLEAARNELDTLRQSSLRLTSALSAYMRTALVDDADAAVIWRGPAKIGVLKQLLEEVYWGELDYLVLDFPPGTGDEVLSACQMIPGEKRAVMVTTPQEVSLADCRKCIDFCRQVEVPVAGVVENMSYFVCPDCNKRHEIFRNGGGQTLADANGLPVLARMPLSPEFLTACDGGKIGDGLTGALLEELTAAAEKIIAGE